MKVVTVVTKGLLKIRDIRTSIFFDITVLQGWRKMGCPGAVTVHRPKSGSRKTRPMRSEPSIEGDGREEVGSGGGVNRVGSSKVKRGSGKRSN